MTAPKSIMAFLIVLLFASLATSQAAEQKPSKKAAPAPRFAITYGEDAPVCHDVLSTLTKLQGRDKNFWFGGWKSSFSNIKWEDGSYKTTTAEGWVVDVTYKMASVNVNNRGQNEVAVIQSSSYRSQMTDFLRVLDQDQFDDAEKQGTVRELLRSAPTINSGNGVLLKNNQTAGALETQIWTYKSVTYILSRGYAFGFKRDANAAFTVSKIDIASFKYNLDDDASKLFFLDQICRIQERNVTP